MLSKCGQWWFWRAWTVCGQLGTDTHIFCRVIEWKNNVLKWCYIDSYQERCPSINSYYKDSVRNFLRNFPVWWGEDDSMNSYQRHSGMNPRRNLAEWLSEDDLHSNGESYCSYVKPTGKNARQNIIRRSKWESICVNQIGYFSCHPHWPMMDMSWWTPHVLFPYIVINRTQPLHRHK